MKNKKILGVALVLVAIAAIAFVTLRTDTPAYGDDQYRSTSFTIQTGWSEAGYTDAVAAFASTAGEDARVVCEIRYLEPGATAEKLTFVSRTEKALGFIQDECAVTPEEFPGCILRAYWTAFDGGGEVTWTFMRQMQMP